MALALVLSMQIDSRQHLPPSLLAEYEKIEPGLARRIVGWTESEQQHRHQVETTRVMREQRRLDWAPWLAWTLGIIGLGCATWLGLNDRPWAATIVAIVSVGGPAAATILARSLNRAKD